MMDRSIPARDVWCGLHRFQLVGKAAVEAARRHRAQGAFLARGRASLAEARRTGEFYAAGEVLEDMRERLQSRMQALRKGDGTPSTSR